MLPRQPGGRWQRWEQMEKPRGTQDWEPGDAGPQVGGVDPEFSRPIIPKRLLQHHCALGEGRLPVQGSLGSFCERRPCPKCQSNKHDSKLWGPPNVLYPHNAQGFSTSWWDRGGQEGKGWRGAPLVTTKIKFTASWLGWSLWKKFKLILK